MRPWLVASLCLAASCQKKSDIQVIQDIKTHASADWQTQNWPMTRGGTSLQGTVRDRVPQQPSVEWTFNSKAPITSEVVISNGLAVFGNGEGAVIAVDLKMKRERWRLETKDSVDATPAIFGDRVFAGSNDGVFRAIDLQTGKEIWRVKGLEKFPTGAVLTTSPDGTGEWVLVNGYDGMTRCLKSQDGSLVWQHQTDDYINGSPVILDGGLLAFGGCDSRIHVIHLNDGSPLNSLTTDAQVIRSISGWGTTLYAVNYANQLVAADARGTQLTWLYESGGAQFLTCPAVDESRVYVGSRDKHLHAVDRLSGKPAWSFKTGGRVESSPLVFDDAVVFGSNDGRMYAVNKHDGLEIWRLDLGENLPNAPAFAAGRLVIGGADGTLFVIRGGNQ
jgi:outer membrane protein assembly factor BamB